MSNLSLHVTSQATLSSSAMLAELSISQWAGNKQDKNASRQVTADAQAKRGVARVNKSLLAGCETLDAIKKIVSETRTVHMRMTLPWSDTGMRIISTQQYFDYHKLMTEQQARFEQAVDAFIQDYQWEVSGMQAQLGNLFNPDDYPTESSLRDKFGFRLSYMPVPDAGDFRVDVSNDALDELKEQYEQAMTNRMRTAMQDIWERARKALANMSERLDYTDKSTRKVFRDTLVDNVIEIVDIMRLSNITNDVHMTAVADKLDKTLRGVTPDALREDSSLRGSIKRDVDNVLRTLPSLDL